MMLFSFSLFFLYSLFLCFLFVMNKENSTFPEIYASFCLEQERDHQDGFTAACSVFLQYAHAQKQATRLSILYILYRHYTSLPLDRNPFLSFFLELVDTLPNDSLEQHFLFCILEQNLPTLESILPHALTITQLPSVTKNQPLIDVLQQRVTRLIDDPDLVVLDPHIQQLLMEASERTLTLSENELLSHERLIDYINMISPYQLSRLMDLNQFVAMEIVPLLLKTNPSYLQALVIAPVSMNSIEVMHHILVNRMSLPQDFLHQFISNSIRACDQLEDSPKRDRQVKQVARFIQSLLEKNIISIADYVVEIQAFCVSYMKLKSVVHLFRLVSN
ncbi:hypothetical protein BD560DRAFT_384591, partial [Blakeslea trispora]